MTDPEGMELLIKDQHGRWFDNNKESPVIKINGHEFYVDELRNSFREVANRWNLINFKRVDKIGDQYGIYFDSRVKNVAFPHEVEQAKQTDSPLKHLIEFVQVPDGRALARMLNEYKNINNENSRVEATHHRAAKRKGKNI